MFRHLLFPLDLGDLTGDPKSDPSGAPDALDRLVELGELTGARVTLFHVVETIGGEELDDPEMRAFYRRLHQRAVTTLGPLRDRCRQQGLDCELEVQVGHRVASILERAAAPEIDLVVMASRPINDLPVGSWPTISFQISMASPVPVLLLR